MDRRCNNPSCNQDDSGDLLLCAGCLKSRYCSKDCQKQNWKYHKFFCKHVSSNGASSASLDATVYYQKIAPCDPDALALASDIGLTLPDPSDDLIQFRGLAMPMRRLVVTGKDTPENMSLFFGHNPARSTDNIHNEARLEILLHPPPGSPMYASSKGMQLDENCPPWTPREPSAAENEVVREIKNMQETIRRHMGSRGVENISTDDMREILLQNFGNRWQEMLPIYQTALNCMDQGVRM